MLTYSQPGQIWALAYLEPEAYSKPLETLTRHIQNPHIARTVYSGIFRHIQNLVQPLHLQKSGISGILEYSEIFHSCIVAHTQNPIIFMKTGKFCVTLEILNLSILTILEYSKPWLINSEPSQRMYDGVFCKNS